MERQKQRDLEDQKEVRKKILSLAEMMQYDDDVEESAVTQSKQAPSTAPNTNQTQAKPAQKTAQKKDAGAEEEKKQETLDDVVPSDEDDDDDLFDDDPMGFIER